MPLRGDGIDTLILGCTHYPLIAEAIGNALAENVRLVSNGGEAARRAAEILALRGLAAPADARGSSVFYTTGDTGSFARTASAMLGRTVKDVRGLDVKDLV